MNASPFIGPESQIAGGAPFPSLTVARPLSVQADITRSSLRLILRFNWLPLGAQRVVARAYAFSYRRPSWRSASAATPETIPVNSPVEAKKTGLLEASANTGSTVSVKVRTPDAFLKRPVPPVI